MLSQKEAKNSTERKKIQRVWTEANVEEMFWFDGNDSFCSNGTIITQNNFPPQNEPHRPKPSFSGVWSIFAEIEKKIMFMD